MPTKSFEKTGFSYLRQVNYIVASHTLHKEQIILQKSLLSFTFLIPILRPKSVSSVGCSLHMKFSNSPSLIAAENDRLVEGTSVINGHKCNKVTSVIKIGHKCNKVTSVIRFGHKCNKVKSALNFGHWYN